MPFLDEHIRWIACSQRRSGKWLSSNMVPIRTVKACGRRSTCAGPAGWSCLQAAHLVASRLAAMRADRAVRPKCAFDIIESGFFVVKPQSERTDLAMAISLWPNL